MRAKILFTPFGGLVFLGVVVVGLLQSGCDYETPRATASKSTDDLIAELEAANAANEKYLKPPGGWEVSRSASKLTDDPSISVSTRSQAYFTKFDDEQPTLHVRCHERTTSVIIDWGEFLGGDTDSLDYEKRIRFRLDDGREERATLSVSTDNEAVGWWSGGAAIPLARRLAKAQRLVVQITPYGESPREAVFDLSGLDQHLPEVAKACAWSFK